ncbi:MAG: hypothetical protein KDE53_26765 [Caldilineaceae bacterium]|nr:hypothetical protein [Caldilineaceae bacterium]
MKPKILILLLLLLLLLMVAAVTLGLGGQSTAWFAGGLDLQDGTWATTARDWLTADLPAAAIVDMRPRSCRQSETRFVLTPTDRCQATITATDDSTRQLQLALIQGDAVTVILEQENALTVELTLERTSAEGTPTASLDIYKDEELRNATLRFTDCRIPQEEEDGEEGTAETVTTCVLAIAS